MSNEERISLREYGRRIGTSDTAVRKAIKAEKIVRGRVFDKNGKPWIIPSIANEEWAKSYDPSYARETQSGGQVSVYETKPTEDTEETEAPKVKGSAPVDTSLASARRAQAVYKAKILELEMKQKQGKLVDRDQVYKALFEKAQSIRSTFQVLPDRVIDDIRAAMSRNEAHKILVDAIADGLELLSGVESVDLTKR